MLASSSQSGPLDIDDAICSDCNTVELSDGGELKLYSERFLMCLLFSVSVMANQILWVTFVPISDLSEEWMGVSTLEVNLLSIVWMILYLPGTIIGIWVVDRYNLRTAVILGGGVTVVGAGMRVIGAYMRAGGSGMISDQTLYAMQLLGQALAGLIQAVFLNLPANVSAAWFPSQERDISTMFASIAGPVGNAIGSAMPALLVNSNESSSEIDKKMALLLLIQFIICLSVFLPTFVFFQSSPPTAPSESERLKRVAEESRHRIELEGSKEGADMTGNGGREDEERKAVSSSDRNSSQIGSGGGSSRTQTGTSKDLGLEWDTHSAPEKASDARGEGTTRVGGLKEQLLYLARNKSYVMLFTSVTIGLGIMYLMLSLVNQIVEPYGYSNYDSGCFNAILLSSGMGGAAVTSILLERTKRYEEVLKGCVFGFTIGLVCVVAALDVSYTFLCLGFALQGFFVLPLLPTVIELTAEVTYPYCSEDVAVGTIFVAGNIAGAAYSFLAAYLLEHADSSDALKETGQRTPFGEPSNIFMMASAAVMLGIIFMFEPTYSRLRLDQVTLSVATGGQLRPDGGHVGPKQGDTREVEAATWSPLESLFGATLGLLGMLSETSGDSANGDKKRHLASNGCITGSEALGVSASDTDSSVLDTREGSLSGWPHGPHNEKAPSDRASDLASDVFSQRDTVVATHSPMKHSRGPK